MEAFGQAVVAILFAGDFDIAGEFPAEEDEGLAIAGQGLIEGGGEHAGLEAGGAEERLLGESDALDGEELLRVDGLVDVDEVGLKVGDFIEIFETDDGKRGRGEAVLTGVLGGTSLAFGSAGTGGVGGVGTVGGELLFGDRIMGVGHRIHLSLKAVARGGAGV